MARILIVGGGCRGLALARELVREGHALRITTRSEAGREAIEQIGAECWIGDPDRLATLRGALDGVTVAAWLLGTASGSERALAELHTTRLELFVTQTIDTTMRGLVFERAGSGPAAATLAQGAQIASAVAARNAIPLAFLDADPHAHEAWLQSARATVDSLLADD